jgi:hypothetical protein
MTGDGESGAWIERLAIADVIYRYSEGVTRGDWDQVEGVFAPDAVWESPGMGMLYDAVAFLELLARSRLELLIQTAHTPVIRLLGPEQAHSTTTIHEVVLGEHPIDVTYGEAGTPMNFERYGIYYVAIRNGGCRPARSPRPSWRTVAANSSTEPPGCPPRQPIQRAEEPRHGEIDDRDCSH